MALNKVILNGRLTADPAVAVSGDKKRLNFTLAVDRTKDTVDFLPCVAWGNTADFVEKYFHKGDGIIVVGSLHSSAFEQNGKKQTSYVVQLESAHFGISKKNI